MQAKGDNSLTRSDSPGVDGMGQVMDGIRDLYDAKWIGCWV
jgi:hypothetical protein